MPSSQTLCHTGTLVQRPFWIWSNEQFHTQFERNAKPWLHGLQIPSETWLELPTKLFSRARERTADLASMSLSLFSTRSRSMVARAGTTSRGRKVVSCKLSKVAVGLYMQYTYRLLWRVSCWNVANLCAQLM